MLPNMTDALQGFMTSAQFMLVSKTTPDFEAVETAAVARWFEGVFEPIPPRRLLVKPEGQRQWKWWALWTLQPLVLDTIIQDFHGKQFRVMSDSDWARAGYHAYELTEMPGACA